MPYKLRKVPKKDLFWVVSKETGRKHSKEGLPKDRAKAQMRALYAAESGAVMKGGELPTKKTSTLSQIARMGYKTGDELLKEIDGWTLNHTTPTLKFYRKGGDVVVGVRGSQTMSDWTDANRRILSNKLTDSARYKKDAEGVADYLQRSPGVVLYGAGHSLGGAILDELIKAGLVQEAVSFNPAVQPKFFEDKDLAEKHKRIYYEGDPIYLAMGRYATGAELRKAEPEDWLAKYAIDFPKVPALDAATLKAVLKLTTPLNLATGAYASLKSHQLTPWLKDEADVKTRGGNRGRIILAGLTALATGVGAVNAWIAATSPDDWSRVFNSAAAAVGFTAAGVLARLGNRRGEAPPLTAVAPQLRQGAQAILHSEALDRVVSLAALTEQGATDDPISLEPFNIGDRVVVLRSLRERGPVLSSQIMSEESWNNTLASGHVLNPSTRQPVTETYTTIIGAGIKSRADKVLRKEAKESGKKSEPSRDEYRAVLAEEALRVLQKKFRKVPFIPPPPPLLRRRRISEGSGDSATEAGSGQTQSTPSERMKDELNALQREYYDLKARRQGWMKFVDVSKVVNAVTMLTTPGEVARQKEAERVYNQLLKKFGIERSSKGIQAWRDEAEASPARMRAIQRRVEELRRSLRLPEENIDDWSPPTSPRGKGMRGGRSDPDRPSRPPSPPPPQDVPPPPEFEEEEEGGFPDVTSFQSVMNFLVAMDNAMEAQGLELEDMTPAFDELMEIILNYEEEIPEEEGEQITFLIQQIYAVAEPYLQTGGMRGGVLRIQPSGDGGGFLVFDDDERVAGPMSRAEAEAYVRSRSSPPRQPRPVPQPPNQREVYEQARRAAAAAANEARRVAARAAARAAALVRRQERDERANEARRIRGRINQGSATAAEKRWLRDYIENEETDSD